MSIASKLNILLQIKDRICSLLGIVWGKHDALDAGLDGCATLLENINVIREGTYFVPSTTQQRIVPGDSYVAQDLYLTGDADLIAGNIRDGVEIFGVRGTYSGGGGNVQTVKSVMPDFSGPGAIDASYPVTPDSPYTSMAKVTVKKDPRLVASNIKTGQTIYGIVGTYGGGSSSIQAEKIGNLNFGSAVAAQYVSIFPDTGYDAMAKVRIDRPSDLDSSNIISGKTIFGVTGTYQPEILGASCESTSSKLQFTFKRSFTIIPYVDIYMAPVSSTSVSGGNYKVLKLTIKDLNCSDGSYSFIDALAVNVSTSNISAYYYYSGSNVHVNVSVSYNGKETIFIFTASSTSYREFVSGAHYDMNIIL